MSSSTTTKDGNDSPSPFLKGWHPPLVYPPQQRLLEKKQAEAAAAAAATRNGRAPGPQRRRHASGTTTTTAAPHRVVAPEKKNHTKAEQQQHAEKEEEEERHDEPQEPQQLLLLTMQTVSEAPFLVGAKGRNISLVRKFAGMDLVIRGLDVFATPFCSKADPLLGRQMALSACTGGVLRWFVTPRATEEGFPEHLQPSLKALADVYQCDLEPLRSRRGHICLMLVPRLSLLAAFGADADAELAQFRQRLRDAREALLMALQTKTVPLDALTTAAAATLPFMAVASLDTNSSNEGDKSPVMSPVPSPGPLPSSA